jgi:L-Ala-D/L-Glu epimerase / N-acetyl-D-glutamate racemase
VKLTLHRRDYELLHPFTISRGTKTRQPALIVELEHEGQRGYGEATPNAYYPNSRDEMAAHVEACRDLLAAASPDDPEAIWEELNPTLLRDRFALCAIDEAIWDLHGKLRGQALHEIWGLSSASLPLTSYTIGLDDLKIMVAKLRERADWPIFKIKLGRADDVAIVRRLREETDAIFRVDANAGWHPDEALCRIEALAELGVEHIEQPLAADQGEAAIALREASPLPIVADESCIEEADLGACQGAFDGVNVKLMKCGGITPARRMLRQARELGLKTMVGCMTESTVGVSAIAQLLPLLDWVDMDGPLLLRGDSARGVSFDRGRVILPTVLGGTGVQFP